MLTIENFSVEINEQQLFGELSLTVYGGAIVNIHGPNGVGKTTCLKALASLRQYNGTLYYNQLPVSKHLQEYRSLVDYIGTEQLLCEVLTVEENLKQMALLHEAELAVDAAIHTFDLGNYLKCLPGQLSTGWRKRVNLSQIFFKNTELLLLDEPFANLDKEAENLLFEILKSRASLGAIIIFSSHEAIANEAILNIELRSAL